MHLNLNLFGSSLFCGSVACCIHQVLTANSLKTFFVKSASLVPALVFLDVTLLEAALNSLTCCVCWTHKDLWWEQGLAGLLSLALWSLNNNTGGLSWRPAGICPHQGPACVFMEQISKCCWVLGKYPVWPISAGSSITNLRSSSTVWSIILCWKAAGHFLLLQIESLTKLRKHLGSDWKWLTGT